MATYSSGIVAAEDGTRIAYHIYSGTTAGTDILPVVCLAGLTRNARDFHDIAQAISQDTAKPRNVVCIDYRGRGQSERAADAASYNVVTEAQDCLHVLDALNIQQAIFVGTSRGGLILHVLAQMALDRIAAGVLNDIGPELGVEGIRQIQAYLRKPEREKPRDWQALGLELANTHGAAFPSLDDADWLGWAKAAYKEEGANLIADCDPAIAAAFSRLDLTNPLPALWQQFDLLQEIPMAVIRGEYSDLLTAETVAAMGSRHQGLQVLIAKGQGHAPLLHKPQVQEPLLKFLRTL